ncbi:MAG TPA: histidine triad nucleotide-binding protein [Candidatus Omnitrophica bacterium]|nr:MAG: histidine triad nucleotide-binding protein [Omnitrophica WOR_2 bacterium GWA2_63_20]OGX17423.1 MAG: histidine triad nucleotide-binding protein [Omnitrophica WOR_2 bacterium GWF2_63_9]OGX32076.1 MAG: histidine triad nucleotide-binding protein [Omnitrophica WOR_2 bacterium RIFCSPHIGHO2_12_FULL_64_13]OGX35264.1 MAG: histidine triad nucleotide-binding protein [Omnitrophica WOR_2 bacterium RIFCSPHIGHO2_02_FULL_63_39]OGX45107.1 MAG: histidine triad nucleotide-binding protein [Omnitrophica WOR
MPDLSCLFCRIVQRTLPAQIVTEDDELLAFKDINPQAPTHLLIIPKRHLATVSELTAESAPLMAKGMLLADRLAKQAGIAESGYRVVINCGAGAGQSVFHIHLHLLGGRLMRWPPG